MKRLVCVVMLCGLGVGAAAPPPAPLDVLEQKLQSAVAAQNTSQVLTLAAQTNALAQKVIATPAPYAWNLKPAWQTAVAHAQAVALYTEEALATSAVSAPPAAAVLLFAALVKENPKSTYLQAGYDQYLAALQSVGAQAQVPVVALLAVSNFPSDKTALLVLMEDAYTHKRSAQALAYAKQFLALANPLPADRASASWIAGVVQAQQARYAEADTNLRVALPLVESDLLRYATALFYLGAADFSLGRTSGRKDLVSQGIAFSTQASTLLSPYPVRAWNNSQRMQQEASRLP